jgi:hypothetical protein
MFDQVDIISEDNTIKLSCVIATEAYNLLAPNSEKAICFIPEGATLTSYHIRPLLKQELY